MLQCSMAVDISPRHAETSSARRVSGSGRPNVMPTTKAWPGTGFATSLIGDLGQVT